MIILNFEQRKALSNFCINIAVAWFVAIFATPSITDEIDWLLLIRYCANIILALVIGIYFLKGTYER